MTEVVGFTAADARKLLELSRNPPTTPPPPMEPWKFHLREFDVGQVSVEVAARVGDTPGSGKVNSLARFDPQVPDSPIQYDVFNYMSAAIEVDTYVYVSRTFKGLWVVTTADCA